MSYLRSLRMERARGLLESSFLSVKEIAHEVGINEASHFVRDFKIIYGVTPTHHRMHFHRSHRKEITDPKSGEDKIRQRIAKAAKGSILPSLNIFVYILSSILKGIEFLPGVQ